MPAGLDAHPARALDAGALGALARGQAAELADHLGVRVLPALRRTRATVTQTDLPESKRHENVEGAFALRGRVPPGSVLVVVDDVSTTGATLDACARVLLAAGAAEVRALTAARVVSPRR